MAEQKEYCLVCGKPNPPERAICDCGGRNFIYGRNFKYEDKKAICDCGCSDFAMTIHIDGKEYHTTNYVCKKCGNVIGTQTYCKNEYLD